MRRTPRSLVAALCVVTAWRAGAQQADSLGTRTASGDHALTCAVSPSPATRSTSADTAVGSPRAAMSTRTSIDTTITLAIADRSWQRDDYDGGVALGAGSTHAGRSRWSACAGVAVHLGHVATTLHNVRGVIHLRADLSALQRAGGVTPDSLSQGSGRTPPAAPPRR